MGIGTDTYANWETGKTEPVASQFRPVVDFLGYDPTPAPTTVGKRLEGKQRLLGAVYLASDEAGFVGTKDAA
jgi:hypothetical protein